MKKILLVLLTITLIFSSCGKEGETVLFPIGEWRCVNHMYYEEYDVYFPNGGWYNDIGQWNGGNLEFENRIRFIFKENGKLIQETYSNNELYIVDTTNYRYDNDNFIIYDVSNNDTLFRVIESVNEIVLEDERMGQFYQSSDNNTYVYTLRDHYTIIEE